MQTVSVLKVLLTQYLRSVQDVLDEDTTSLVIVRHPFSRISSAYYSKLVALGFKNWNKVGTNPQSMS